MLKYAPIVAFVAALLISGTAVGHNWGADPNSASYCNTSFDSKCSADDSFQYVYYNFIPTNLKTAFNASLQTDYYILYEAFGDETANSSDADVIVREQDTPNLDPAAYTTCSDTASFGAYGWNKWCKKQVIVLDDDDPAWADTCFNSTDSGCRNWVACHELGHTFGLQHDTRSGSCMNKEGTDGTQSTNLDGHDTEHIADCYPHPLTSSSLTYDCDTYQSHY